MRMEKKRILKEDGRYLVYYHFVESATEEQTVAFDAVVPANGMPGNGVRETASIEPQNQSPEVPNV